MSSYDAAQVLADLREEYEQNELDRDRTATEPGFVKWLALRTLADRRATPHLDAVKAERDAALARADSHRCAAHEAAGQLDALRREVARLRDEAIDRQAVMTQLRTQRDWLLAEADDDTRARYQQARQAQEVQG